MGKFTSKIRSKLGMKPKLQISDETYKYIAQSIKEEHLEWSDLNEEILIMLLRLSVRQYPTEEFQDINDELLRTKIRNAFIYQSTQFKELATPLDVARLNAAYTKGKQAGMGVNKYMKILGKKLGIKNKEDKIKDEIEEEVEEETCVEIIQ
jgi:hypothetical protein